MIDDPTSIGSLVQFGVAGLVGWMWLSERRASGERERQITEAHARVLEQRTQLDVLMKLVSDNTRALAGVEAAQRSLAAWLSHVAGDAAPSAPPAPAHAPGDPSGDRARDRAA